MKLDYTNDYLSTRCPGLKVVGRKAKRGGRQIFAFPYFRQGFTYAAVAVNQDRLYLIAVATQRGLLSPVVKPLQEQGLHVEADSLYNLAERYNDFMFMPDKSSGLARVLQGIVAQQELEIRHYFRR